MKKLPLLPTIVTAVILVAVITGLFLAGSPALERKYRMDEQRVSDLTSLRYSIIESYYTAHSTLPDTLDQASAVGQYSGNVLRDPQTGTPYEYHPTPGTKQYSLCAVFDLPTDPNRQPYPTLNHVAGRTCFDFAVGNSNPTNISPLPYGMKAIGADEPAPIPVK
jgi:hypothetical protein